MLRAAQVVDELSVHRETMSPEVRRARLQRNLWLIPAIRALRMCLFGITVNVTYFQVSQYSGSLELASTLRHIECGVDGGSTQHL